MEHIDLQLRAVFIVCIAAILSAVPGWDRERRQRPAGLRTHMLVGMSSAMITAMARLNIEENSAARVVANILTGIGFLGSGVILQRKGYVYDVTTAASIWMVALVGIVVGYEWYILAGGSTFITWFVLVILRNVEDKTDLRPYQVSDVKETASSPPK